MAMLVFQQGRIVTLSKSGISSSRKRGRLDLDKQLSVSATGNKQYGESGRVLMLDVKRFHLGVPLSSGTSGYKR